MTVARTKTSRHIVRFKFLRSDLSSQISNFRFQISAVPTSTVSAITSQRTSLPRRNCRQSSPRALWVHRLYFSEQPSNSRRRERKNCRGSWPFRLGPIIRACRNLSEIRDAIFWPAELPWTRWRICCRRLLPSRPRCLRRPAPEPAQVLVGIRRSPRPSMRFRSEARRTLSVLRPLDRPWHRVRVEDPICVVAGGRSATAAGA